MQQCTSFYNKQRLCLNSCMIFVYCLKWMKSRVVVTESFSHLLKPHTVEPQLITIFYTLLILWGKFGLCILPSHELVKHKKSSEGHTNPVHQSLFDILVKCVDDGYCVCICQVQAGLWPRLRVGTRKTLNWISLTAPDTHPPKPAHP